MYITALTAINCIYKNHPGINGMVLILTLIYMFTASPYACAEASIIASLSVG